MDYKVAVYIEEAAIELGFEGFEAREHYQGRSFYNRAALVYTNENELIEAVAYAAMKLIEEKNDGLNVMDKMDFIEGLPSRRDNLGKNMIAY